MIAHFSMLVPPSSDRQPTVSLSLTKVKDVCEKIQHFGTHKDETGKSVVVNKVG
ncbi:MAG: hypothetical protein Q9223_007936, partial [Gallowayella weberi]